MSSIFREKSLERMSSPEQLDDYIRVTTPSVWMGLLAVVILLAGILAWSMLGTGFPTDNAGNEETVQTSSMTDTGAVY